MDIEELRKIRELYEMEIFFSERLRENIDDEVARRAHSTVQGVLDDLNRTYKKVYDTKTGLRIAE